MKIAYISSAAYSDVDLSIVSELQKTEDTTYIVLVHPGNIQSCALNFKNDSLQPGLNNGWELEGLRSHSGLIDINKSYVLYSDGSRPYSPKAFYNAFLFSRMLSKKYDIIHLTTAPALNELFLYLYRKKIVLTVHDPLPHSSSKSKGMELRRKIAFRMIKNLILLNSSQKESFISHYRIVHPNLMVSSLSCYNYLRKYNPVKNTQRKYILYFGNIVSYKGLDYLFPAMEKVHDSAPDLNLVVAGKGAYYFDISKYERLEYFDIQNRFIPDDELAELIYGAEFVVVPYVDATQSGVVMSAYAFNKPCVATNVGGLPEMVINGKYGEICDAKDVVSLSDSILRLYNTPGLINQYIRNIRNDYDDGVKSWPFIVASLVDYYKKLIK